MPAATRASRFVRNGHEHAGDQRRIRVSFEFFPPKTEEMEATLWESITRLAPLEPNFVSVTYGAGGSTRERTHATVERIVGETALTPAAHLTCVAATRDEIDTVIRSYCDGRRAPHRGAARRSVRRASASATRRIPAATATPPISSPGSSARPTSRSRSRPIRKSIPTARLSTADLDMLKAKVDAGATRAITQFFFDNDMYFRYLDRVRARPASTCRSCPASCRCRISSRPSRSRRAAALRCRTGWLSASTASTTMRPPRKLIAAAVAAEQVLDLVDRGVTDFHFYTMNRADLVYAVCHLLGLRPSNAPDLAHAAAALPVAEKVRGVG